MQNEAISNLTPCGNIEMKIEYQDDKPPEIFKWKNQVLTLGRVALAKSLSGQVTGNYQFYINRMIFGDGGTTGGVPKYVTTERNGLFGLTRASKPVIASINPEFPSQATFISVLTFQDANGYVLSEMALQMATGDLYSMSTFPDLTKTAQIQITYSWSVSFL